MRREPHARHRFRAPPDIRTAPECHRRVFWRHAHPCRSPPRKRHRDRRRPDRAIPRRRAAPKYRSSRPDRRTSRSGSGARRQLQRLRSLRPAAASALQLAAVSELTSAVRSPPPLFHCPTRRWRARFCADGPATRRRSFPNPDRSVRAGSRNRCRCRRSAARKRTDRAFRASRQSAASAVLYRLNATVCRELISPRRNVVAVRGARRRSGWIKNRLKKQSGRSRSPSPILSSLLLDALDADGAEACVFAANVRLKLLVFGIKCLERVHIREL